MVVRPLHRVQHLSGIDLLAGLEQQDVEAALGERVGRHAAGRTRADDDGVVGFEEIHLRLVGLLCLKKPHGRSLSPIARLYLG